MASFCHFVFFFESTESGEAWVADHERTFLRVSGTLGLFDVTQP